MATSTTSTRTLATPPRPSSSRRKKDQPRSEIWSNLLRQTREAQARTHRQSLHTRDLIVCGGTPEDQRDLLEKYLTRPPPTQPPAGRNTRDQRPRRAKGELKLSNRFGYGYGHVTLFSPPQGGGGAGGGLGLFGGEVEEVAKVEVHTVPEAEQGYEETLRRLLVVKREEQHVGEDIEENGDMVAEMDGEGEKGGRRAGVCILMSWKEPWVFLDRLRRWFALLSRALLPSATMMKDESPLEVIKEHQLNVAVVLQHTDNQEFLLRESYTEESFDYISQCLRTCLLPISAALVYVPTSLPPQQPGGPLTEVQKVLYAGLNLDVSALQVKDGKPELAPKHNVVDRMAIVVPSGWDSVGKIRLLSETFSPEAVMEGWTIDLTYPLFATTPTDPQPSSLPEEASITATTTNEVQASTNSDSLHAVGAAEVYESAPLLQPQPSPLATTPNISPPLSPSKAPKSAINDYELTVQDPNAHKAPKPPEIEVSTKPEQEFLAEMRAQLQSYEAQDAASREKEKESRGMYSTSTTTGALNTSTSTARPNQQAAGTGEALSELGDVSFNVGGVSYNTVSAEAAIERLKRPNTHQKGAPGSGTVSGSESRSSTPRPSRREQRDHSSSTTSAGDGGSGTPSGGSKGGEIPTEKLEEYFYSLMKKGGGAGGGEGSRGGTPRRSD